MKILRTLLKNFKKYEVHSESNVNCRKKVPKKDIAYVNVCIIFLQNRPLHLITCSDTEAFQYQLQTKFGPIYGKNPQSPCSMLWWFGNVARLALSSGLVTGNSRRSLGPVNMRGDKTRNSPNLQVIPE